MSGVKKLVKHSSIYAIGKVSGQLIGFIMLPVYTRYLEPSDYGIIGLITILMTLIGRLFGARMTVAVPKYYYEEQRENREPNIVVSTALQVTIAISMISTSILIIFSDEFSSALFGTAGHNLVLILFSLTLVTAALEQYALVYIRLQNRPYLYVGVNLSKLAVQLGLNIWLVVFLDLKVLGVAISAAASSLLFAVFLLIYTAYNTGVTFNYNLAKRMVKFTWPLWVSSLAGIYIWSSSRLFLRYFGTLDDVGLLELAAKFASVLMLICWEPFFQYWQTERFNLYQSKGSDVAYQSVFYFITTILVIIGLGISIFSDPAIRIMAAPAFHGAALVVPFLVIATMFNALTEFSNFGCLVKDRTDLIGKITHVIAVLATVIFLLAVPLMGLYGAAIAIAITRIIHFFITDIVARRQYDPGISLKPLMLLMTFASLGYITSNILLRQDDILLDIVMKLLIYGAVSTGLILVLIRDPAQRERANDIWLSVWRRVRTNKNT